MPCSKGGRSESLYVGPLSRQPCLDPGIIPDHPYPSQDPQALGLFGKQGCLMDSQAWLDTHGRLSMLIKLNFKDVPGGMSNLLA